MPDIRVAVFYGGVGIKIHKDLLKNECPHIVVGTPGRILALGRDKDLGLKNVRHFVLDECDKMLESLGMIFLFFLLVAPFLCQLIPKSESLQQSCFIYSIYYIVNHINFLMLSTYSYLLQT